MKIYSNSISKSHQDSILPLLDWRSAIVHRPTTLGGRYLQHRFGIQAELADTIARLAGLGLEEARQ